MRIVVMILAVYFLFAVACGIAVSRESRNVHIVPVEE